MENFSGTELHENFNLFSKKKKYRNNTQNENDELLLDDQSQESVCLASYFGGNSPSDLYSRSFQSDCDVLNFSFCLMPDQLEDNEVKCNENVNKTIDLIEQVLNNKQIKVEPIDQTNYFYVQETDFSVTPIKSTPKKNFHIKSDKPLMHSTPKSSRTGNNLPLSLFKSETSDLICPQEIL